jgi:hypothetical protein
MISTSRPAFLLELDPGASRGVSFTTGLELRY